MKKDKIISIIILSVVTFVILVYFWSYSKNRVVKTNNIISVVYLEGTIGGDALSGNSISTQQVKSMLNEVALENPKGMILRIDSPGGLVTTTEEIFELINNFKNENNVKVYVSMGSTAASGGYYLSCLGDKIYAMSSTVTGSIGVIVELFNYEELMSKIGIKGIVFKSGEFKDMGSPYREISEEEKKMFQKIVDTEYEAFLNVVSASRGIPKEKLLEFAQGQIFLGTEAKSKGLIDSLGSLEEVERAITQDLGITGKYYVSEHKPKVSILSLLFSMLNPEIDILKRGNTLKIEYKFEY